MLCSIKKAKGGIFLGLGIGILAVMWVPLRIWLAIIGIVLIVSGLKLILGRKLRR